MKSGNKREAGKAKAHILKPNPTSESELKAVKSARRYDGPTLKLLWGRSAGRCALPDCRIELFVTEPGYDPVCIIGEMGHVIGSSDAGPRSDSGKVLSERDRYENLILLCRNCHRKIDVLAEQYPTERLQRIKADHEAWVRTALPERGASNVRWKVLRLQGDFPFDATTIGAALSPDQLMDEVTVSVSPSRNAWSIIHGELRDAIESIARNQDAVAGRLAVFPLAPVSACIFTGYLLTNRINVRAFQYHRDQATWIWPRSEVLPTTPTFRQTASATSRNAEVLFLFQLTAPIDASALNETLNGGCAVYECIVPDPSTSWLKSKSQLDELARKAREMFETASASFPRSTQWHILYAGPAPGAVVIGQQLNPTMVPLVQLYEFQFPAHVASITIGREDSPLARWGVKRNSTGI